MKEPKTPALTQAAKAKDAKAAKPAPKVKATPKAKPAAKPTLKVVAQPAPVATAMKLKDLIAAVAAETGGKRPDVRATVEATLAVLADALKRGADLNLPPLGRMRVARATGKDGTGAMTLKLRFGGGGKPGAKALADDGGDS